MNVKNKFCFSYLTYKAPNIYGYRLKYLLKSVHYFIQGYVRTIFKQNIFSSPECYQSIFQELQATSPGIS